jgi:beta-lactamase class A
VSESGDKRIAVSGRQGSQPRRRQRPVQKVVPKKVKAQPQPPTPGDALVLKRLNNNNISPPVNPSGGRRPRSEVIMPSAVKPLPKTQGRVPPAQPGKAKLKTVRLQKPGLPKVARRPSRKTQLKPMARTILYALRLLIVGVGMGAIVGTMLSILDPASRITSVPVAPNTANTSLGQTQTSTNPNLSGTGSNLYLSQEIPALKNAVQNIASANPNLTAGVFLLDLDNGSYVDINASTNFPAASTIKIPILLAFFQDVDAGKVRLDEKLTMQQEMIAGGSGNFQYKPAGTQFSALEVATKMITISDNTATNMLIAKLGGKDSLNERFRTWGLGNTVIRNALPDLPGTNTTSPKELGTLMAMVNQGNFLSMRSRDMMLDIMRRTERDNLLPSGLDSGAKSYHKTGDIATMLADAGLIDVPTGKRYVAAVMVKRPNNDPSAEKLISSISRAAYQHLSQAAVTPTTPANRPNTTSNIPAIPNTSNIPNIPNTPNIPNIPNIPTNPNFPTTGYPAPVMVPNVPNDMMNPPMGAYPAPMTPPEMQYYPPR